MKTGFFALILSLPAPVMAQDWIVLEFQGAQISFTLDDPLARAGFTRFMSVDAVSFEGVVGPARLAIELALPPGGDRPHDARIMFRPDGYRDYWLSPLVFPDDGVVIDDLTLSGADARISGRFETPLCFTATALTLPDPARCDLARGQFQTGLHSD